MRGKISLKQNFRIVAHMNRPTKKKPEKFLTVFCHPMHSIRRCVNQSFYPSIWFTEGKQITTTPKNNSAHMQSFYYLTLHINYNFHYTAQQQKRKKKKNDNGPYKVADVSVPRISNMGTFFYFDGNGENLASTKT